jgi:MFS family permease
MSLITESSQLIRGHLPGIAMALVSMLMAVYGSDVSRLVRRTVRGRHFLIRAGVFFFLVVCGYGILAVLLAGHLARWLGLLDNRWLAPVLGLVFLAIVILAEERRQF